jgi:hypothetical protein
MKALTEKSLENIYDDFHDLLNALVALAEHTKLPDYKYADATIGCISRSAKRGDYR